MKPKTITEEPNPVGRPSGFKPEYVSQALKLAEAGFTDLQMADWFECDRSTFYRWCVAHPELRDAIKIAKDGPDDRTERSLFHRANGYEWIEQQAFKVKEVRYVDGNREETERVEVVDVRRVVPPDATSAIFWLKNRRGWKDKSAVEHDLSEGLAALMGLVDGHSAALV